MRKFLLTGIIGLLLADNASAQYYWDVGLKLGGANYLGEMGGKQKERRNWVYDIKLLQTRWMASAFARYRPGRNWGLQGSLTYARIQGRDNLSTYPERYARNLNFKNDFLELAGRVEYYFYTVHDVGGWGRYQLDFRSYLFGGVGGIYHGPKSQNQDGSWTKLRPLTTEGQAKPYSPVTVTFPLGVGLYYTYKRKHRFGWEFSWMTTFTDYLDDASTVYADPSKLSPEAAAVANRTDELDPSDPIATQLNGKNNTFYDYYGVEGAIRGDPTHDDAYLFTGFSYSKVIRGKGSIYRSKYNYVYGNKRRVRRTRAKF